jgi:hypothetical protein
MTEWQRITWHLFHTISLNYNDKYKEEYIIFFDTLKTIIPCGICRKHYIENTSKNDMEIDKNINNDKIFNWTIDMHNSVNKMNRKKIWNHDESRKYYEQHNFNNKTLKFFIYEYIRANFRKNFEKTTQLLRMMNTLPYIYPYEEKRNKLIDFKERFELNRDNIKQWLFAFLIILKS